MRNHLPPIRNYQPGDETAWLALIRACPDFQEHFFNRSASLDALRTVVEHPNMDPAHNLLFADSGAGFAGYAELWCAAELLRAVGRVLVHPDWRSRGLGTVLLQRIEERARSVGSHYLDISIAEPETSGRHFLEHHGFSVAHYRWQMQLSLLDTLPAPRWPAGYAQRIFAVGQDERAVVELENASFADAWEYVLVEVGEIEGFVRSPSFRPDGVILALHSGQLVGECWSWIDDERIAETGDKQGAVWCLCVRPQHRGLGLGRGLLLAGLRWLQQQGMRSAVGAVDGANERAQRLYRSVGCEVLRTDIWYRKPLGDVLQSPPASA
jgi:mycothiol synthase